MQSNEDGNPRISQIDSYWDRVYPALNGLSGTQVRDQLNGLRYDDPSMFNALYWRIDAWMASRLSRRGCSESETDKGFTREDIGPIRLAAFVSGLCGGPIHAPANGLWWHPASLPKMLSEIDGWEG